MGRKPLPPSEPNLRVEKGNQWMGQHRKLIFPWFWSSLRHSFLSPESCVYLCTRVAIGRQVFPSYWLVLIIFYKCLHLQKVFCITIQSFFNMFDQNQGKSSSTPVTSDLSKTFHQICLWLHQLVKNQKSTEDNVIYLLGNPQRNIGDWLTLINKLDTIATYSIQQLRVNNNKPLLTRCACVCACRPEVPPYRTKIKIIQIQKYN